MVLESVAHRLTQETQLPGELGRQKHLLEQTVHACLDDLDAVPDSGFGTAPENHELASAGQDVVARAAAYIVRKAAPAGAAVMHTNASAMQNVNTEELVNTTKDAIAEAVTQTSGTSEIDELSILLLACHVLDAAARHPQPPPPPAQLQWAELSSPTVLMPSPPEWYVPAAGYV